MTLCDPMDCSPLGSSFHGILPARKLEWVAIPFSRRSSQPRDQSCISCVSCLCGQILYRLSHQGSPNLKLTSPCIKTGVPLKSFCVKDLYKAINLKEIFDLRRGLYHVLTRLTPNTYFQPLLITSMCSIWSQ